MCIAIWLDSNHLRTLRNHPKYNQEINLLDGPINAADPIAWHDARFPIAWTKLILFSRMLKISSTSHNIIEMEKQIQVAVPKKNNLKKKKRHKVKLIFKSTSLRSLIVRVRFVAS